MLEGLYLYISILLLHTADVKGSQIHVSSKFVPFTLYNLPTLIDYLLYYRL